MDRNAKGITTKHKVLAAALAAGAGMAIAAPASALDLSIYGIAHVSGDSIDLGTGGSSEYIQSNSSRLGFRGSHGLGGGLEAIFQYESGVDPTGQSGPLFTGARDSFVGLKGGFGTVRFGRLGGLNQWLYGYNLFADQVGDLGNIWGGDGLPGRVNKVAHYGTPDFGGFSVGLSYAPDQGVDNTSVFIAKADFATGGLKLGGALYQEGKGTGLPDTKATAITGSYDFGAFSVGGGWQTQSDIGGTPGKDRDAWTLGAKVKVGTAGAVKVQYASADDIDGTTNTGGKQWAIGYDHALNKATTIYVAYADTTNDSAATFKSYGYGHGTSGVPGLTAGEDPSAVSIGIVVRFNAGLVRP